MKTAGIRELKAKLSEYLRQVQKGETVLVTDRGGVVAELRPPGAEAEALTPAAIRFRQAVESGLVLPSSLSEEERQEALARFQRSASRTVLPKGSAARILDGLREDRS